MRMDKDKKKIAMLKGQRKKLRGIRKREWKVKYWKKEVL